MAEVRMQRTLVYPALTRLANIAMTSLGLPVEIGRLQSLGSRKPELK